MSRYYQSSYHGSNDYKKYREERLGKNTDTYVSNDKKSFGQDFSYRPQSRRDSGKEHLQTFGKQTGRQESRNVSNYNESSTNHRQAEMPKREQASRYEEYSFLPKRGYTNEIDQTKNQQHNISTYIKDKYGADDRPTLFNEDLRLNSINPSEVSASLRGKSRPIERYSRTYDTQKNELVSDGFEDSIITRRRNYQNLNNFSNQDLNTNLSSKTYNYSNKLKISCDQPIQTKKIETKDRNFGKEYNFEEKYKTKSEITQNTSQTSPYRSRNQMIKERLNINAENGQSDAPYRSFRRQFNPIEEPTKVYETRRQFIPSQIKTAQVTPQKSQLISRQDKNASQQRRKSLIQKSQMLKEKLSKMNASCNTKAVENQENLPKLKSKAIQKQNKTQNYTPKRYMTNSFRATYEDSQHKDKSVSKRLNFDDSTNRAEPLKTMDRNTIEPRPCSSRNYYTNSTSLSGMKESLGTQVAGEGALRKISELNERINSRLESILKNYG